MTPSPDDIPGLIQELDAMAAADPNKGTEFESVFLDATRPRTQAIGRQLDQIGGMAAMLAVHQVIFDRHGTAAARMLEMAWDRIGDWRD